MVCGENPKIDQENKCGNITTYNWLHILPLSIVSIIEYYFGYIQTCINMLESESHFVSTTINMLPSEAVALEYGHMALLWASWPQQTIPNESVLPI